MLTDEQREAKRLQAEAALDRLLCEDGWATWLRLRRNLHDYSWGNQALIAAQAWMQAHDEEMAHPCAEIPTLVKAGWKWKKDGYHPAKGSRGLLVWAYMSRRRKDKTWICCNGPTVVSRCPKCGKQDHYFVLKATFDASQVVSFEDGSAPVVELPPSIPIEGDSPGDELVPGLVAHALLAGWADSIEIDVPPERGEGGWFRLSDRTIGVCPAHGNAQLRTLIHEIAHALGISSKHLTLSYAECEVAVECVSYMVASTVGLDTSGESIPYIAGWGGEGARDKVRALAQLIDATAKQIEAPLLDLLHAAREAVAG